MTTCIDQVMALTNVLTHTQTSSSVVPSILMESTSFLGSQRLKLQNANTLLNFVGQM